MSDSLSLLYLTDAEDRVQAVQIPWDLWQKIEPLARPVLRAVSAPAAAEPVKEAISAFEEFLQFWDFRYPYNPAVSCPHCGASTQDWREDPEHPFWLTNANVGGLLVFHCRACGTTIRQKHFRDHVALEHTSPKA